jgi:rare lipoprotein A (peptidoglycan hydrolase)
VNTIILYLFAFSILVNYEPSTIPASQYRDATQRPAITATPKAVLGPDQGNKPVLQKTSYKGLASFYSRAGCLGCSESLTMANGEPLDDSKLTLAFMRADLGTMVKITNVKTGQSVIAKVTDRGGFENLKVPKIADLSVATKEAIGCGSICEVEIEL